MSNEITSYIIPLLEANGFYFKRGHGKHPIWTDGKQNFTLPSGTTSSSRMRPWLRSELRKKCLSAGRPFIDPTERRKKVFNTARIVPTIEPTIELVEENPTPQENPTIKKLDLDALDFCIQAKKEKHDQVWMAEALTALGYRGEKGGVIRQPDISDFMIKMGHRTISKHVRKDAKAAKTKQESITLIPGIVEPEVKRAAPQPPKAEEPAELKAPAEDHSSEFLDEIKQILSANLSIKLKEKILKQFCRPGVQS